MVTARASGVLFCWGVILFAQQAAGPPAFEVASIKPSQEGPGSVTGIFETRGRIDGKNVTLKRCIRGAYGVPEPQILGGPAWAEEDRFYIEAKAAGPAGGHDLMLMLQTLLAERFKLVLHREQRAIAGFRLVVRKGGLKAKASAPGGGSSGNSRRGQIDAAGYTMAQLALRLAEVMHQPVMDATEVTGRFDFKLEWSPDALEPKVSLDGQRPGGAPEPAAGPSIFAALQEQLGLRLEPGKVPAEVLVIDSAEKPSEN